MGLLNLKSNNYYQNPSHLLHYNKTCFLVLNCLNHTYLPSLHVHFLNYLIVSLHNLYFQKTLFHSLLIYSPSMEYIRNNSSLHLRVSILIHLIYFCYYPIYSLVENIISFLSKNIGPVLSLLYFYPNNLNPNNFFFLLFYIDSCCLNRIYSQIYNYLNIFHNHSLHLNEMNLNNSLIYMFIIKK